MLIFLPLLLLSIGVLACSLYYCLWAMIYFCVRMQNGCGKTLKSIRHLILIPAHNEELIVKSTLDSLNRLRYDPQLYRVIVIADNCVDNTKNIVEQSGFECFERANEREIGNGYAISWALSQINMEQFDSVIIIDADTIMHPDFLGQMSHKISKGSKIIQGFNHMSNPDQNSLTRLMAITSILRNKLFYAGKARVGYSSPLLGTGMCFTTDIIRKYGWRAFSIGEDFEQYLYLLSRGEKVDFNEKACVFAEEASRFSQAHSQRIRWAGGKFMVTFKYAIPTLRKGLKMKNLHLVDGGLSVLVPNYSQLAILGLSGLFLTLLIPNFIWKDILIWLNLISMTLLIVYFLTGLLIKGGGLKTWLSIILVPFFLIWKAMIDVESLFKLKRLKWIRTNRL
jgi:cellulose synthase/poly-beta-1,6-N-acetylglucosamine synthase-like glycosyltransferase